MAQRQPFVDEKASLARPLVQQHVVAPAKSRDAYAVVVVDIGRVPAAADENGRPQK